MAAELDLSLLTAPRPAGLSLAPTSDGFSERQWKILMAFMNTVIPAIQYQELLTEPAGFSVVSLSKDEYSRTVSQLAVTASPDASSEVFEAYLAERPADSEAFAEVLRSVLFQVPQAKRKQLQLLLSILSTCAGSLILTGYKSPITRLPAADRIKILHRWRTSSLWTVRSLFKTMTTLGKLVFMRTSTTFDLLTGFPSVPPSWKATPSYPYEFLQFQPPTSPSREGGAVEIETDVVIVGSGCGAGVCAWRLANSAGPSVRVLVLEKGHHFDASCFPMSQKYALSNLYEAGGVIESDDGSMTVTAGSCFGGGGTVNWSAGLQTQDFVRREWAKERNLPFFESPEFQASLDMVCESMGVLADNLKPNHGNRTLLDGAAKLGYQGKIVPQNCGNTEHHDGHCTLGCWRGEKKGPVNGWFPEAAKNGVKFAEGMAVDRVLFEQVSGKKVAKGVTGVWTAKGSGEKIRVVVKAKKVIVSGGSLWSPIVLMNSGLKNPHIGKSLYLHPTNFVAAVFDEEVKPWEGGSLTSVVGSLENLDGKGHGVKLEAMSMMPSFCMPFLPWASGPEYKLLASKYRHMNVFIAICRDRDTGHVYRDPEAGVPRIAYSPSDFDRAHNLAGMVSLAKILRAQGAREIHPCVPGFPPFIRSSTNRAHSDTDAGDTDKAATATSTAHETADDDTESDEAAFAAWLRAFEEFGNKPPVTPFASAHQMGSCRMSALERDGVVDPRGRVWGTQGLYVADASVFPSASGVNPMVTVMAVADWIAQGVCEDLAADAAVGPSSRL
ncbi:hypothetical protein B0T24DRAFT_620171 [Lasiosphaeria ovina]|uniref:Long-chain-alcohol oxidase n=1 Tax=Lasiosphaeria ovina TaxID=92902 RepID=A0AAE0NB97_9PEZI|nr:hypothetical protein B0T24DRAFT_620171 [Lasiosphaeria ovina]